MASIGKAIRRAAASLPLPLLPCFLARSDRAGGGRPATIINVTSVFVQRTYQPHCQPLLPSLTTRCPSPGRPISPRAPLRGSARPPSEPRKAQALHGSGTISTMKPWRRTFLEATRTYDTHALLLPDGVPDCLTVSSSFVCIIALFPRTQEDYPPQLICSTCSCVINVRGCVG
jgi:hypothetical protein